MNEPGIIHVAIAPPATLEPGLIVEVAAILGKDIYGTGLLLAGKIPKIVAHCQNAQSAELIARRLRVLGLMPTAHSDSTLRTPYEDLRAHTMKLTEDAVLFYYKSGRIETIKEADAFLILQGTIRAEVEIEIVKSTRELNLPATLLLGGIPIWRRAQEKPREQPPQSESFVRLYDRIWPNPRVEIFQSDFDYSFLGPKTAPSSIRNLGSLIKELNRRFPQAIFDNRLTEPFRADIPFTTPREDVDINCRLIYLYHQAMSNPGPPV